MSRCRHTIALTLLVSACGGSGGDSSSGPRSQPPPSVHIAPIMAELTSGGAPVSFSATLSGTSPPVTWTLTGPGSLSSTSGPSVTYTPPSLLSADTDATLVVAAGGVEAQATIRLAPGSGILVSGRVVDFFGSPVGDVAIHIGAQTTRTDGSGRFALGNVSTPYVLVASSIEKQVAVIYQGLTRLDPTVFWREGSPTSRAGTVRGAIGGGAPVSTSGVFTLLGWMSPEARTQGTTFHESYSLPLRWTGGPATTGAMHILQMTMDAQGLVTGFPGYGVRRGVTVGDGSTVSNVDVSLTPPAISSVRGSYTLPPSYALVEKTVGLDFDDGTFFSLGSDDGSALEFAYVVPGGIDASVGLVAEARGEGTSVHHRETGIPAGATNVVLDLPRGAPALAPVDGANGIDGQTEFSWKSFPGGIYTLFLSTPAPAPTFYVVTEGTHALLPQLADLPVPSGTAYRWSVIAQAPIASVDDASGPGLVTPSGNTVLESVSESRIFVTR